MQQPTGSKPCFVGIGAQKSATTWLYDILADHPGVSLSEQKELDFFSYRFDCGYQWYERQFPAHGEGRITGEVSPSYFHTADVPERIRAYAPDMKLILFLREPVQRAISNHKHEVRIGHLQGDDLSFEAGLANNPLYIDQGLYATHLERWLDVFSREQLLIVLFDDVVARGAEVAGEIYRFLGIDPAHRSVALQQRSNESYVNRSGALEASKNRVRAVFRGLGLAAVWRGLGSLGLQRAYRAVNRVTPDAVIPPLLPETRRMLEERYAEEIDRLEQLAGLDLAHWRARHQ